MPDDKFGSYSVSLADPADFAEEITSSNDVDLTFVTRAIYVGSAGNLRVKLKRGGVVTFVGLAAGTLLPIRVTRVYATDTTAGNIVGLE